MGMIKSKQSDEHSHELKETEFNYLANIYTAKQTTIDEFNRSISAFLKYVAVERLGYPAEDNLQFEVDFSDKKRTLKVTPLPKS